MSMRRGYVYLVIAFFFWGSLYVVNKYVMDYVPPLTLHLFRQMIAVVVLGLMARRKGLASIPRNHWPLILSMGPLAYFVAPGMQNIATNLMNASMASLLNTMNPLFICLFAVLFLKEEMTRRKTAGVLLSFVGVAVVLGVTGEGVSLRGFFFALLSVLGWSSGTIIIRKLSGGRYSSEQIAFMGMAAALPFSLTASFVEVQTHALTFDWGAVAGILYLATLCTALPNVLWNRSLEILPATSCSQAFPLQPFFATLLGVLFLHEAITWNFLLGGALISAGVIIGLSGGKGGPIPQDLE
ncbi:MAG: DMT family transporter [Ruminiclostridium sp.]|nr:DMT family transporter [Ruminiclostridium sp.]